MKSRVGQLLLAILSVAISFIVVLTTAFWISKRNPNLAGTTTFPFVTAFVLAFTAAFVARLFGIPIGPRMRRRYRPSGIPQPSLPTPPHRQPPTPQQRLDYTNDPSILITCPHLRPIERAMRAMRIDMSPMAQTVVKATCRVHQPSLLRQFDPLPPVSYMEYFLEERATEDTPIAHLLCSICESRIDTYHPSLCSFNTRWFPAPPPSLVPVADQFLPSQSDITAIACSPTGRFTAIAAGIHNTPQSLAILDTARAKPIIELPPHGVIRSIAWSPDERILVTGRGPLWTNGPGAPGPSIFVWDVATGTELLHFGDDLFGVRGIALSPDGRFLLASGMLGETPVQGSTFDLWDLATGRLFNRFARVEPNGSITVPVFHGAAFTPDGTQAFAACGTYLMPPAMRRKDRIDIPRWWNLGIRAWSLATGQETDLFYQSAPITTISVSNDGTRLFFGGGRFGMWDLTTQHRLWDKQNSIAATAVSPECTVVARGRGYRVDNHGPYDDTGVELYDGATGERISQGLHRTPVVSLSMTSHAASLIAGGEKGEVRFWHWPNQPGV
jgi:hypothetical protein